MSDPGNLAGRARWALAQVEAGTSEMLSFSADRRCPKCTHVDVSITYQSNSHEYACRTHRRGKWTHPDCEVCKDEHLDRHCRGCGYEWREEVAS